MVKDSQYLLADRRQARRYRVAIPVEHGVGRGQTRDISTSGLYLELDSDRAYSPGESLSFTLLFEHADPDHLVHLHCQGVVVRVEPCSGKVGIAVRFMAFHFGTHGESSPVK